MRPRRTPTAILATTVLAALLAALPPAVLAHAELVSSQPAIGAVLDAPPTEVVVTFDSELDPDTSSLAVSDADGAAVAEGGVDLDVAERNVLRAAVGIEDDGEYEVAWTAGSIDGHAESGTFTFRVGEPSPTVANTAVPAPSSSWQLVGAVLIVAAVALGARTLRSSRR